MGFPKTVEEALALSVTEADAFIEKLDEIVGDKMAEFEPDEDFVTGEGRFLLAFMIEMLNHVNALPENPFGAQSWVDFVEQHQET